MNSTNEIDFQPRIAELGQARRLRLLLVVAFAVVCAIGVGGVGYYFGYELVGGDQALVAFLIGAGIAAGPGVLLVVLAYLVGVRSHLRAQFATGLLADILRELFDGFAYDADKSLEPEEWRKSDAFPDSARVDTADHLVRARVGDRELRFCHLELSDRDFHFDGLFVVADFDQTFYHTVERSFPAPNALPTRPVVDEVELARFVKSLEEIATFISDQP